MNLGGELTQEDKSYWIVIVKDLEQKGYFIKIVDKEVICNFNKEMQFIFSLFAGEDSSKRKKDWETVPV